MWARRGGGRSGISIAHFRELDFFLGGGGSSYSLVAKFNKFDVFLHVVVVIVVCISLTL